MKYFKLKFLTFFLTALLAFGVGWAGEETVTYTFTSKSWEATPENWTGSSNGSQFNTSATPLGVQILASLNGLTVTSPKSYNNISKIVITYSSSSKAAGYIRVYIGDELIDYQPVEKNKTMTPLTYTVSNKSGIVKFQNLCQTNSYGINSIAITYEDDAQPSTDPVIEITSPQLPFNDEGGLYTVKAANMPDNGLGVIVTNGFARELINGNNEDYYFPLTDNAIEGAETKVTYTGRELSATGTITFASGEASKSADLNYRTDIYIVNNHGDDSWNFGDGIKMTYNDGVYTGTFTAENANTKIVFARMLGDGVDFDTRLVFGADSNDDWLYGTYTSGNLNLNGDVAILFPQAGAYTITIDANAKTFSIASSSVYNIAEALAYEGDTFTYMGSAIVTYQNGKNLWIRDGNDKSGLIYGTLDGVFDNGDLLTPGWKAGNTTYLNEIHEFNNPQDVTKAGNNGEVEPLPLSKIEVNDINKYASISGVTITRVSGENNYFEADGVEYNLRDEFSLFDALVVDHVYNVVGVVSYYSGKPQLWLTEVEDVTPKELKVTLESETKSATIGETIPVTVTVENAEGDYTVTYKFGENGVVNTLTGNTINVTSETAGEVKLYVTVTNNGHEATAQGTYTFTEPLIGSNVFVKVTSADQLVAGKKYIIVCGNKAMGSAPTGNFLTAIGVNVTAGGEVEAVDDVAIMTLAGTSGHYTLALGEEYLHAVNSTSLDFGNSTEWAITDYNGTLDGYRVKHADYSRAVRYRSSDNRFGNYATSDNASDYGWIYVEKTTAPQPEPLAVTLTAAPEQAYTVGDKVTVTATVENGTENTVVTYKIGEGDDWQNYPEGGIVLPNTAAGDVVVTVKATDGTNEATDEVTYHFNAAKAFEITLTATPAQETYEVNDVVNVKVAVANALVENPTITYTIGETREAATYNPETGINVTSATAGTVKLTVNVTDGYEHVGESTATADYVFVKKDATLSFGETTSFTVYPDADFTAPTPTGVPEGATVTYSSDNEDVAVVDENTGEVVIGSKTGTAIITATFAGNDEYNEASATYTITVEPRPIVVADEDVEFELYVGQTGTETFTVMGENLKGDITLTLNDETGFYSIEPKTIDMAHAKNATVTVTYAPTTEGIHEATVTLSTKDAEENVTVTLIGMAEVQPVVAMPTFSLVAGSYTGVQQLTISCATEGATISYSTDGGQTWTEGNTVNVDKDMTIMAKASRAGYTISETATAAYIIDIPEELPTITPFKGYYQIKNNGNGMYANIAGRKTLNFTDAPADKAGTVIWLETNDKGQVQSIRSQAADLQGYANRAMRYVPEIVELVADKLNADGEGNLLGETGLEKIMEKFNESFDHHLYVEQAGEGWRLYGKTPSMQPVVEFYRENTAQVEAKLPMLESFINSALNKLKEKIGGQSVFTEFSLRDIWQKMGGTLTEPIDDASTMAFYREVLNNKNYVWDFAYQTAMIYVNNLTSHDRWSEVEEYLGEYAQYIDKIDQIRPDFKYYVVADGNKPDFISEGNKDIINDAARTIWTLEDRSTFTVNIPANAETTCDKFQKATTLYTDFAYELPEGVTAYKVTDVVEGTAITEALSGVIPAQTPVLLMAAEAGDKVLTLSTEAGTAVTDNLLVGPDYLINTYKLTTPQVEGIFNMIKEKLGEDFYNTYVKEYEHLMYLNSGTVNNKYFWGLKEEDVKKCTYLDEEGVKDYVVRGLEGNAFVNNKQVKTNKAFLVSEDAQIISLNKRGDVNHDGKVNIKDVTDLIDRLLDPENTVACPICSDFNLSGKVDIKDVTDLIDVLLTAPYAEQEQPSTGSQD